MPTFSYTVSGEPPATDSGSIPPSPDAQVGATALRDIKIDTVTGDIALQENDLDVDVGIDGIASDINARINTFGPGQPPDDEEPLEGEWYLDTTIGVDFWGKVFRGAVSEAEAREAFVSQIVLAPGVIEVRDVLTTLTDREFTMTFEAPTDLGLVIVGAITQQAQEESQL